MKLIVSALLVLAIAFALAACTGAPAAKDYDVRALAKSIAENCTFEDAYIEEAPNAEFTLQNFYNVDPALIAGETGAKEAAVYVASSGPEGVICFKAVDEASANTAMELIQNRILEDIEGYKTYGPEKVPFMETAVKIVRGAYVVIAITADNTASASYIEGLLK